jgi:hypothetical protein
MKQIGSVEKIENLMRNLTILLSNKLQKCWLCSPTFVASSPLVAIGDRIGLPGSKVTLQSFISVVLNKL